MQKVLLLNSNHDPLQTISWEDAICLVYIRKKAYMVTQWAKRVVRTATQEFPRPAVIALKKYVDICKSSKFNRTNVLARDRYRCMYCGVKPLTEQGHPRLEALTFDHVVPRAYARKGIVVTEEGKRIPVTCWENIVMACGPCNLRKGARTPAQAGLKLLVKPRKPNPIDAIRIHLTRYSIPEEWKTHLKGASVAWAGYYEDELQES